MIQDGPYTDWHALIEQEQHQRAAEGSRLWVAKSKTAFTCWIVNPSNMATISLTVWPSSKFSKRVATGIRVPRKTHAPLTLPGTLSTAGHLDQSRGIG